MLTANQVLDRYYLEARCMLIELGATLDRHDRAAGSPAGGGNGKPLDPRLEQLYQALSVLSDRHGTPDRSERVLNLFSDPD